MRVLLMLVLISEVLSAQSMPEVRGAVTRALPLLQKSAGEFVARRACVSCHHNVLTILTLDLARGRGFQIDEKVLAAVEDKTFRGLRGPNALDEVIQASTVNDPTPDDSYLLMAARAAGSPADLATAVYARRLARWQRDGHWVTSDFRPPHSSSLFTATATALRAIRAYMPEELAAERDASIRSARKWLSENRPVSTEDAAFRLMGLAWADASRDELAAAQRDLIAMQKPNGGWAQLASYPPDAYSTGEALFALHEAAVPLANPAWTKGLKFLTSTQAPDGTWQVHTRMLSPAEVSPPYFETGFPYGKDQFLSYAGSCWAVMALASALPESSTKAAVIEGADAGAPPWLRTALFGTASQLAALLDAGLDPDSKTKNGTTILMAAAADVEKVRVVLSRHADVKARTASGADALTVAASYRGTLASIKALIEAGAPVQPPEGVRARKTPLLLASMTGDLENVQLLLSLGAAPSASALSQAVTFDYPYVVRALIAAGADTDIVEGTGINLLHWAAITNRPAIIPLLAQAHVPIDATDDQGFTPLMYAATIDFGDTDVLKALLNAGADKSIRNHEGRTALDQTRRYKHSRLEAALK